MMRRETGVMGEKGGTAEKHWSPSTSHRFHLMLQPMLAF